jgi:hypothetical protein
MCRKTGARYFFKRKVLAGSLVKRYRLVNPFHGLTTAGVPLL